MLGVHRWRWAKLASVTWEAFCFLLSGSGKDEKQLDGELWSNAAATLHDESKAQCCEPNISRFIVHTDVNVCEAVWVLFPPLPVFFPLYGKVQCDITDSRPDKMLNMDVRPQNVDNTEEEERGGVCLDISSR